METLVGTITHYYKSIGVAAVEVSDSLEVGSTVHIKGHTTDFEQKVDDMQYDHKDVTQAEADQEVGVLVKKKVREGDEVFLL